MDSLHAIGFYVSAAVSLAGALVTALPPSRGWRAAGVALAGVGIAGLDVSLSAGFAGAVVLVCYAGCALLLAGPQYRLLDLGVAAGWRQVGAVAAAALFAALAFAAFRGDFAQAPYSGGWLGSVAVSRLMFSHDALATIAVAALTLVALAGATAAWRGRERTR